MTVQESYQNLPAATFIVATIYGKPHASYSFPFCLSAKQENKEVNDIMLGLASGVIVNFEITRRNSFTEYTKSFIKVNQNV